MGFRQDARFVKVWELENKGNYHVVSLSTSKKNKETFVRFIWTAHNLADDLKMGDVIKLGSCEVTNKYDKDKNTTYTNYLVYSFEKEEGDSNSSQSEGKKDYSFVDVPDDSPEELPFN